jgi:hypothetical protein
MRKSYLLIILVLFTMCKTNQEVVLPVKATAPLIIYKTKANYSDKVPITLNESKNIIVSYPSPKDVFCNGILALPQKIKKGYFLDNIGIGKNTVFTSYTFEEYSKLESAPTLEQLMKSIIDMDPFVEIYDCGVRRDSVTFKDLTKLVSSEFNGCKRIK